MHRSPLKMTHRFQKNHQTRDTDLYSRLPGSIPANKQLIICSIYILDVAIINFKYFKIVRYYINLFLHS
jgi:hypothetical protein